MEKHGNLNIFRRIWCFRGLKKKKKKSARTRNTQPQKRICATELRVQHLQQKKKSKFK